MIRATLFLCLFASPVLASVSNAEICAKAGSDNRLGEMTEAQCACFLDQGDRRMDRRLARLWKEALYTGQSREAEVLALGISQSKMERQMHRTLRDARKSCGVQNPFGL